MSGCWIRSAWDYDGRTQQGCSMSTLYSDEYSEYSDEYSEYSDEYSQYSGVQ